MKAIIYYTKSNVSGFSYTHEEGKLDVRIYDEDTGEFICREKQTPDLNKHYEAVDDVDFPLGNTIKDPENVSTEVPTEHLEAVFHYYNTVKPSEITDAINEGLIDVSHSSMSVGDVIEIEDNYFIVCRMGFERIEFEEKYGEITKDTVLSVQHDIHTPFVYFGKHSYASVEFFAEHFGKDVDEFITMLIYNDRDIAQWFRVKKS